MGQPRTNVGSFIDYLSSIVGWERFRASQFGIHHYCTIGLNSKEANNEALAEAVMDILPLYLSKEGVVAVGEIGYDDQTALEDRYYRAQLQLAREMDMLVMVHTPHRDKKAGTIRSMDVALEMGMAPGKVIIDHNNEETVRDVLDRGFWAGFTLYPQTKMGNERMVEIVRQYGSERIFIDSSADWGVSDPLAVPKTARLMLERGIARKDVEATCYGNALLAYGQSGQIDESHWLAPESVDQRALFEGNSVLRGQVPRVEGGPGKPGTRCRGGVQVGWRRVAPIQESRRRERRDHHRCASVARTAQRSTCSRSRFATSTPFTSPSACSLTTTRPSATRCFGASPGGAIASSSSSMPTSRPRFRRWSMTSPAMPACMPMPWNWWPIRAACARRRTGQERPGVADAACSTGWSNSVSIGTPLSWASAGARSWTSSATSPRPPIAASAISACPRPCWRRTIPGWA